MRTSDPIPDGMERCAIPGLVGLIVHGVGSCGGPFCAIHRPDPNDIANRANWPFHWRSDRGLIERICPHGVGPPSTEHITFVHLTLGKHRASVEAIHGCDGCCTTRKVHS